MTSHTDGQPRPLASGLAAAGMLRESAASRWLNAEMSHPADHRTSLTVLPRSSGPSWAESGAWPSGSDMPLRLERGLPPPPYPSGSWPLALVSPLDCSVELHTSASGSGALGPIQSCYSPSNITYRPMDAAIGSQAPAAVLLHAEVGSLQYTDASPCVFSHANGSAGSDEGIIRTPRFLGRRDSRQLRSIFGQFIASYF